MSVAVSPASPAVGRGRLLVLVSVLAWGAVLPLAAARALDASAIDHLVISEIVTGGASASDELIELYNPSPSARALEGLELVYVSASGATMSGRAAWSPGAPVVPPGGHVLVANEAGIHAALADAVYSAGIAAGGGSVALRVQGGDGAIDAVGWGTAAGSWREGSNAPAPAVGASIERLPGGPSGSTQDTDDNAADFVERPFPDPQHLGSAPTPDGGPTASAPDASPTVAPSVAPTSSGATQPPTTSPSPAPASVVPVAAARAAPNETLVTVEAIALTGSDFHDGGGFVADASGGIAVLVEDGSFARGSFLRVTGTVEDRFAQRTIRARGSDVARLGVGEAAAAAAVATGSVDESTEGRLVRVAGIVRGSPATLAAGTAHDLDDGTGTVRVIVPAASGIDSSTWAAGARVELVGVAGQRDATGSGSSGYRVMPRDVDDVIRVEAGPPSPSPSAPQGPSATPTLPAQDGAGAVVPIGAARSAPKNERVRVRGVVTMPTGIVDPLTAVVQDDTAAIVLRLGNDAGGFVRGERIEAGGTRSTLSGMETLRVDGAPLRLGTAAEPVARAIRTGDAGEAVEAALVSVRGALVAAPRRASSGTVTFEIDDGSGGLRVSLDASIGFESETLDAGTLVEVRGVLGQETSGAQPLLGYRIWPRSADDVRVIAIGGTGASTTGARDEPADAGTSAVATGSLGEVGGMDLAGLRVAATLVVGPWAELGIGGLLWDGERLVAVHAASSVLVAALGAQAPIALELAGLRAAGTEPSTGVPLVALGEPDGVHPAARPPAPPSTDLGDATDRAVWISLVGRLADGGRSLAVDGEVLPLEHRCDEAPPPGSGIVGVTAVALGDPARLIAPCGGIRAAPAVGRPGAGRASQPPRVAAAPAAAAATPGAAEDGRRGVVAGMFVLSAAMLGGAAIVRRRSAPRDGICGAEPGTGAEEGPLAQHLTLVSVRRERGP